MGPPAAPGVELEFGLDEGLVADAVAVDIPEAATKGPVAVADVPDIAADAPDAVPNPQDAAALSPGEVTAGESVMSAEACILSANAIRKFSSSTSDEISVEKREDNAN